MLLPSPDGGPAPPSFFRSPPPPGNPQRRIILYKSSNLSNAISRKSARKASQSLRPQAQISFNHFLRRRVRRGKYFTPCKCGISAPLAQKLCAQQGAPPSNASPAQRVAFEREAPSIILSRPAPKMSPRAAADPSGANPPQQRLDPRRLQPRDIQVPNRPAVF